MKNYLSRLWWTMKYDYQNMIIVHRFASQLRCFSSHLIQGVCFLALSVTSLFCLIILPLWIIISPFWLSIYHAKKIDEVRKLFKKANIN